MPNADFKSQIYRIEIFLLYNSFVCLTACLPAIRPGSTMARSPVFSHNTCIIGGFTNLLFRRRFAYCAMLHLFILPFVSSSISLIESEKWYKEGINEVIQNYAKPHKDRILSVLFPLHF